MSVRTSFFWLILLLSLPWITRAEPADPLFPDPVTLPNPGAVGLRVVTPDLLEIRLIATRKDFSSPLTHGAQWEKPDFSLRTPEAQDFSVLADGQKVGICATGVRRVPIYAGYWHFDLRLLMQVFLRLEKPLAPGTTVAVQDTHGSLLAIGQTLQARCDPARPSPAIHFSRHGFAPDAPKFAFIAFDLGTLGELDLPDVAAATVSDISGKTVWHGPLERQNEEGWQWHQKVWRCDFSSIVQPGEYYLCVPGLGRAGPLRIDPAAPAVSARLLALAFYHQRSGVEIGPPFTRFAHPASHTRPAEVPTGWLSYRSANRMLEKMAVKNSDPTLQSAPVLKGFNDSLYPIQRAGPIDVCGGHYDAGDYSKYVINSAQVIHALTYAVDFFPNGRKIDNLGLPESGDGVPDALQIAQREAEFLLKMQDDDGGFFFLVYPRDRAYELDVLPEHGDPQVVFPKNTAATAACSGALAQIAASPAMLAAEPAFAARCLAAARKGYAFLHAAIAKYGFAGSYQTISHYGNFAGHRDELCFAAAALYVATGEEVFQRDLMTWWPDPLSKDCMKWSWIPLTEGFGCAARLLAQLPIGKGDSGYRAKIHAAILAAADVYLKLSAADAYGLPLSLSTKRQAKAGWFWAMEPALDLAAASLIDQDDTRQSATLRALAHWSSWEAAGNPLDRAFLCGAGPVWRRQTVNRMALNDDRVLAPPGIPIGNLISCPQNLKPYELQGTSGLRKMFFPFLDTFAFHERSLTDAYNVREEWTVATGARLLAGHLFLLGRSPEALRPWVPEQMSIELMPATVRAGQPISARLRLPNGFSCNHATVIWEWIGQVPQCGTEWSSIAPSAGPARLEAEIVWPDGRRLAAALAMQIAP